MNSIHYVQHAIDYIEDHVSEPLELQDIADKALMSVPNLYRAFYALTGHPIKEYIRKRRISIAAWYLRYSKKTVLDIALDSGFESYQAFTKMFKSRVGMTPGAYRKAEIYFSFESLDLLKNITYLEEREISEWYPDVKVIQFHPHQVLVYQYQSSCQEGIEEEALRRVFKRLESLGCGLQKVSLFGYNVEFASHKKPYGYTVMIPYNEDHMNFEADDFRKFSFPGGLYAVGKSLDICSDKINTAWDRLLSAWLPKSTFELGQHQYFEEFLTYQGEAKRIKLYLPVKKKVEPDMIETIYVEPFTAFTCRGAGPNAQHEADDQMTAWLYKNEWIGKSELRLFMSYNYGIEPGEDYWYELGILAPELRHTGQTFQGQTKTYGGGFYACVTTRAYGTMIGVVDRLYRWIYSDTEYLLDETRQWFAEYIPTEDADIERSTLVKCYIPIVTS